MIVRTVRSAVVPILVVSAVLMGCSDDKSSDDQSQRNASTTTAASGNGASGGAQGSDGSSGSTQPANMGALDALGAIEIALAEAPGTAVVEVDQHEDKNPPQWEVTVVNSDGKGVEFRIDNATRQVLSRESEGLDPVQQKAPAVTAQQAIAIAVAATPGEVFEADLTLQGGRAVWEIEVRPATGMRVDVIVDAVTGEVLG